MAAYAKTYLYILPLHFAQLH